MERILAHLPDGVVVLNVDNQIVWSNEQFRRWTGRTDFVRLSFYAALNHPEILGPDFCPFNTALATGEPSSSTLRTAQGRYYHVHAAPVCDGDPPLQELVVTIRDVTEQVQQQQKLTAIHQAGVDLANIKPAEVGELTFGDRIDLLKSNILHYTQDLLRFDVVEIRLLNEADDSLHPLLSIGLDKEASERVLRALPKYNGVTGFVAATGKSYLCEDTTRDPLYLTGFQGAKSSMTVPLLLHEKVIGTFNVESPKPRAFTETDLQFLEIFSRDIAVALNTLDLLAAQNANTAWKSVTEIHRAVARPVDEILNAAVNVLERYMGHDAEVQQRLQDILARARDIKQVITNVGQTMAPAEAVPVPVPEMIRPKLNGRRVLVVDADEVIRTDAHTLLERYGCTVETATDGTRAAGMVKNCEAAGGYAAIISDIRLPDMSGYGLMCKLQELIAPVPLILMTGFGYDGGHSIVKARLAGLHPKGVLFKPFRLEQLLDTVETIIQWADDGGGPVGPPLTP